MASNTTTVAEAEPLSIPSHLPKHMRAVRDAREYKPTERTLIICLDGTGDKFDSDNSNIVHLVSCLKKDDRSQVTYYQSGIGTYDGGGLSNGLNASLDMAVGSGLGVHIRDAYQFLMTTYNEGDKICLFGFSRGAYTARCLAGMIHKVGLLPAGNVSQIPFAYASYKDDTPAGWETSCDFKSTFSMDVDVHFIGVFDSVASVGLIPRKLPLSSTPTSKALYFRHAIGLDERRSKFKVSRYQYRDHIEPGSKWKIGALHEDAAALHEQANGQTIPGTATGGADADNDKTADSGFAPEEVRKREPVVPAKTDFLEVFFAGCHADVGGGAVKNEVRHKLAQIPLRWMIRQCFLCNTGIIFDTHRLAMEGLDVHTLWPMYTPLGRPTSAPSRDLMAKYTAGNMGPIRRRTSALEDVGDERDEKKSEAAYKLKIWEDDEKQIPAEHWVPEQVEDYFE